MKEEYKDFIGIYDESVPVELCNEFVDNFKEAFNIYYISNTTRWRENVC